VKNIRDFEEALKNNKGKGNVLLKVKNEKGSEFYVIIPVD
jgi:hypothetical protein